jgi:hypothetical protein
MREEGRDESRPYSRSLYSWGRDSSRPWCFSCSIVINSILDFLKSGTCKRLTGGEFAGGGDDEVEVKGFFEPAFRSKPAGLEDHLGRAFSGEHEDRDVLVGGRCKVFKKVQAPHYRHVDIAEDEGDVGVGGEYGEASDAVRSEKNMKVGRCERVGDLEANGFGVVDDEDGGRVW